MANVSRELAILIAGRDTSGSAALRGLRNELLGVDSASKQAGGGMDQASGKMAALGNAAKVAAVAGVAALGVAVVAGAKSAIDAGISWESAFAGVRKTVDATDEELAQFSAGIRKMATEIPASREEIAKVAEAAGQLGVKKEALLGFTKTMIDLGNTTNMSSEQAADSLARLANITGMPQENFDRLGSTVVALGNTMAATEAEIVSMGMRLAGAGEQVGLTEAQILAFASALSSVGIEAEMGGSAFSRVMIDMSNAVQKGGDDLEKFADVAGMSAEDFAKKFKEDAAGALVLFLQGLGKVKSEGGNVFAVLENLGLAEIRVRDTVLRASSAHELFSTALKTGSKAWAENTALTKEAEQRYATTASKIEIVKNKFGELGVELFERAKPAIHGVIDAFSNLADFMSTKFLPALDAVNQGFWTIGGTTGPAAEGTLGRIHAKLPPLTNEMWAAHGAVKATNEELVLMSAHNTTAANAMNLLSAQMLLNQDIALNQPPMPYGDTESKQLAEYEQRTKDINAAIRAGYASQQDAAEVANDYSQKAYKNSQDAARKTAQEAEAAAKRAGTAATNEAEKVAEKVKDTLWDIGALGRKMVAEVADALAKETDLWEAYGQRWIEQWFDVDAAIKKTYQDRETALAGIEESEAISKDRDARKRELSDRINGEKKVFDLRMDDTEFHHREELAKQKALTDYQKVLNSSASQEAKNNAWEIYRQRLDDLVQEHQAFDAEVQWRLAQEKIRAAQEAIWATEQAALEKTLHEEELTRQRGAIDARQQAEEARINAEWAEWQQVESEKTTRAAADAKERARANLEAWRDEFIDKLDKESEPGIERFIGMVAGKWANALASMGAAAASASSSSSESAVSAAPNGGTTSPITIISSGPATSTTTPAEGWVPSFAAGGIVPGPVGAPVRAVVHGGERVLPLGRGSVTQVIQMQGNYVGFDRSSLEELARQLKPYLDSLVRL